MTFFREKFPFSRRKFLMTFFTRFSDFTFLYCIKCRIRPFLHQKTTISEKSSLIRPFFYSVRTFAHIRQHYFSKYWENQCMGRPTSVRIAGGVGGVEPPTSSLRPPYLW